MTAPDHDSVWLTAAHGAWIASFEDAYPALFARLREAGWRPGEIGGPERQTRWASEAILHPYNPLALQMELELGGLTLVAAAPGGGKSRFQFAPGQTSANLKAAADDYDRDVRDIVRSDDPFPVGEGHGWVLFVAGSGRSALIEQALAAYIRADEPFVLLDALLTGARHDARIEHAAAAQGTRVTGRPGT
jgi:hypothetical protein